MLFNSIDFTIFLPIVFFFYWFVCNKNLFLQNLILLVASYIFYSWWDWRFLFLLIFSISLDYFTGIKIYASTTLKSRKTWLAISVIINVGFLAAFKYYNFFINSFANILQSIGFTVHYTTLSIIIPVGISFYTFHGLSYVFDIFNKKIKPSYNFINYSLFVSFFPLLVAGPIERATHLLPQVEKPRKFIYADAVDGFRQILWGLFKKMVIADNCAIYANFIFNGTGHYSGSTLLLGALFFTFQIYGDFSGYSDIAIGTARLFGFSLLRNFSFPYFSRDIAEFWRRWHISLSSWFKDYLYKPLGGSKGSIWNRVRNTFVIFLVSGFWHGANWTFIFWGFINACYFLPLLLFNKNRDNTNIVAEGKLFPSIKEIFQIGTTFFLIVIAWIFFRSKNLTIALNICFSIFSDTFNKLSLIKSYNLICGEWGYRTLLTIVSTIILLMTAEWLQRDKQHALESIENKFSRPLRWSIYMALLFIIAEHGVLNKTQFIYFTF